MPVGEIFPIRSVSDNTASVYGNLSLSLYVNSPPPPIHRNSILYISVIIMLHHNISSFIMLVFIVFILEIQTHSVNNSIYDFD